MVALSRGEWRLEHDRHAIRIDETRLTHLVGDAPRAVHATEDDEREGGAIGKDEEHAHGVIVYHPKLMVGAVGSKGGLVNEEEGRCHVPVIVKLHGESTRRSEAHVTQ